MHCLSVSAWLISLCIMPSRFIHVIANGRISFFFFFFNLFIYLFLLCWVFVSVRGLSLIVASRGHSSSQCAGLSPLQPLLLRSTGSRQRRLSNCGSRAQLLRGMWDLPRPGLEPVSPALAGRFSTTAPPGKPRFPSF